MVLINSVSVWSHRLNLSRNRFASSVFPSCRHTYILITLPFLFLLAPHGSREVTSQYCFPASQTP